MLRKSKAGLGPLFFGLANAHEDNPATTGTLAASREVRAR